MNKLYQYFLQKPEYNSAQIADYLYDISDVGPVDDPLDVYNDCKAAIHDVIYNHLGLNGFMDGDVLGDELPESYGLHIIDLVENEYQAYLDSIDLVKMVHQAEQSVLRRIEQHAWRFGLVGLADAVRQAVRHIESCASQYEKMQDPVDDSAVKKSFSEACKITLTERIASNNSDDIHEYRQDLIEYLELTCANRMYAFFARFFSVLSCSSQFMSVEGRIRDIESYILDNGGEMIDAMDVEVPQNIFGEGLNLFTAIDGLEPKEILERTHDVLTEIFGSKE
mgnify:CR=1 FL=1